MTDTIVIEEASSSERRDAGADEHDRVEFAVPPREGAAFETLPDHAALQPAAIDDAFSNGSPDDHCSESVTKLVPQPVTVEEVPEDDVLATQTTEAATSPDAILTPKLSARTTMPPPTANKLGLSPLQIPSDNSAAGSFSGISRQLGNELPLTEPTPSRSSPPSAKPADVLLPPPSALSFLDADSPPVTKEAIRQSTLNATRRAPPGVYNGPPSAYSHSSMGPVTHSTDGSSRADATGESAASWSPEQPFGMKAEGPLPTQQMPSDFHRPWPPPDGRMPPPPMSHVSGSPIQPRHPGPASAFPYNDQVPLSGYQLVAAKLAGDLPGMHVKPIYRRFEGLNHRLLLSLQDEIGEMEEKLRGVDAADTQNRSFAGGVYPASRRQEARYQGDLYWRKRELLEQIGHRLWQYNKLLISFRDMTDLHPPTIYDIQDYRAYLNSGNYIVNEETHFLTATNDLIALDESVLRGSDEYSEDLLTPMPRSATEQEFPIQVKPVATDGDKLKHPVKVFPPPTAPKTALPPAAFTQLAFAIFAAVLVPIFTFAVIPDFVGRLTVVILVASGVLTVLFQSGLAGLLVEDKGVLSLLLCVGVYGGVMAMTAATFR